MKVTITLTTAITFSLGVVLQYVYIIYKKAKDMPSKF